MEGLHRVNSARDAESPSRLAGECVLFYRVGQEGQSLIIFPEDLPL